MDIEIEKQIERLKQELKLYLTIAERLHFPKEEVEKQLNLYLENLSDLLRKKSD